MAEKKDYTAPEVKQWGSVADLTKTGKTFERADAKTGSVASMGG